MILAIGSGPDVSGRRDELATVDAALAASPFAGQVSQVFGVRAAPCDRLGERWAKARGVQVCTLALPWLPTSRAARAATILTQVDAVLFIWRRKPSSNALLVRHLYCQCVQSGKPIYVHTLPPED